MIRARLVIVATVLATVLSIAFWTNTVGRPSAAVLKPVPSPTVTYLKPIMAKSSHRDKVDVAATMVASGLVTFTSEDCRTPSGAGPASDLASGDLDYHALAYLERMLAAGFRFRLNCLWSGHNSHADTSLHPQHMAFDIDQVNGEPVSVTSVQTRRLYDWFLSQVHGNDERQLPFEIGGPLDEPGHRKETGVKRRGPFFTNAGHSAHVHVGVMPARPKRPDYQTDPWWG